MNVHPTAIVDAGADLHADVQVGPFCHIGPDVQIGSGTALLSHVVVQGPTRIGAHNRIYPFACVGLAPQDRKFGGEPSTLVIGDHNVIREGATLNRGTRAGRMETRVGSHCMLMGSSHVAHDCVVGDHVTIANCGSLAGHVEVGDYATLGGLVGVHQFCRIGRSAFLAGGAKVAQDVPPFCIAQGDRAQLMGINVVGLRRHGWDRARVGALREAFRRLFQSGGTRLTALEQVEQELATEHAEVRELTVFVRSAKRGVCQPRAQSPGPDYLDD
jgi:UDP-N-acetylglucosamine acyltransferase